jgi:transposase
MDVMFARCAGLDVHPKTVVACVLVRDGAEPLKAIRTVGTTTRDLRALETWLTEHRVTHVAMESTGSYWKPVFNLLEEHITTWLVNPALIKAVPGRKTDVKDAEWIADLLQHGLLQPSFIPDHAPREWRELTRDRKSLIEERAREANRIQKVLKGGTIKRGAVLSDVLASPARAVSRPWPAARPIPRAWPRGWTTASAPRPRNSRRPWRASWGPISAFC